MSSSFNEVVVTGVGLVTCLGADAERTWAEVRRGRCGLGPLRALESRLEQDKGGGEAPELQGSGRDGEAREVGYLRLALREAIQQAFGGRARGGGPTRMGIVMGTTLHGMRRGGAFLRSGNPGELRGFLGPAVLSEAIDGLMILGRPFDGMALTTCAACSSGLSSVGLGMTLLREGELDVVIVGGYDPVSEYAHAGFDSLRVVARGAVRPFCRGREGMKVSEGYGVLVLERAGEVAERGGTALACIRGYGESADAHHLTLPHPSGEGAARAIEQAIASAGVSAGEIGLIAAHATATPNNDAAEYAAFARVFGAALPCVPVVAFKSHLGHTLGGAGAVELILAILAMRDGVVPPTANVAPEDVEFPGMDLSWGQERPGRIELTLNTSLGFGGANTCVVAGRATPPRPIPKPVARSEVAITGIGVIVPGAVGNAAFAARFGGAREGLLDGESGAVEDSAIEHLFASRRVRRMSDYVKLTLAATALALEDAGVAGDKAFPESCSAILGTTHGSTGFCEAYYGQIVREGPGSANPVLFAEGVPNAASAQMSLMLGLRGGCQTIIGSRTSGLDALRLAALRVASGEWDRAIVGAAEEHSGLVDRAYRHCGLARGERFGGPDGFVTGAGAVTFIVERRDAAVGSGRRVRGLVRRGHGTTARREERSAGVTNAVKRVLATLRTEGSAGVPVLGSANATWIDDAEGAAGAGAGLNGWLPELFSAGPLAGIAAVLLTGWIPGPARPGAQGRTGTRERAADFDQICTDYAGPVAGVRLGVPG